MWNKFSEKTNKLKNIFWPSLEYIEKPFPKIRNYILDLMSEGKRKNLVYGLFEIKLNQINAYIKKYNQINNQQITVTCYFIKTFADTVSMNRSLQAFLYKRKSRLVIFHDVDVTVMVERKVDGVTLPIPHIIRAADKKTIEQISQEILFAKRAPLDKNGPFPPKTRLFYKLPKLFRKLVWFFIRNNPSLFKKTMGTVAVTSLASQHQDYFFIPISPLPLTLAIGGNTKKLHLRNGVLDYEHSLQLSLSCDHDIYDGKTAFRFYKQFKNNLQNGFCLFPQELYHRSKEENIAF